MGLEELAHEAGAIIEIPAPPPLSTRLDESEKETRHTPGGGPRERVAP